MILFPAIDLKEGQCVRLEQGDMARTTVFNADPVAQAGSFEALGFEWLHLVDLDGAFAGEPRNEEAVIAIREAVSMPIQLGGGIRDRNTLERWLGLGISRVVLGTIAVKDPDFVHEAAKAHPTHVAVGIDARDGKVAVEGWAETSELDAVDLAKRFEDAGVAAIIYTDIERDGLLSGVNVEATEALAQAVSIPVIASGGVAGLDDIKALKAREDTGIAGAVIGRALYDGRLNPQEALALARKA